MDAQTVKSETERVIDEVMKHVNAGHNFLLSGGAGSGKTYTLAKVFFWEPPAQVILFRLISFSSFFSVI